MAKPYYQVDFSASACLFEIRVNDVLVFTMNIKGQASTMVPVNTAILQSGKQQVAIKLLPLEGEHTISPKAEFKYDIKVFDVTNDFQFMNQLPGYQFPPIDTSKVHLSLEDSKSFNAEVPYTLQAFQNGVDLRTITDLQAKLRSAYQRVANVIDRKDYEQFRQMLATRENDVAVSMYLTKKESEDRIVGLIYDFEHGFKTEPLAINDKLHLYASNRVAALKKPNGESALTLLNKQTGEELMIDLSFYLPQGKTDMEVI